MTGRKPQQKIGSAYRIRGRFSRDDEKVLELDRSVLQELSGEMSVLLSSGVVITASPDWRTICLYSDSRWDELSLQLRNVGIEDPEARRIQRVMLGCAMPCKRDELLVVERILIDYAHLEDELVLIVFGNDNAELWNEAELARIAGIDIEPF